MKKTMSEKEQVRRAKISATLAGRPTWNKGRTLSAEHRRKIGLGLIGKKVGIPIPKNCGAGNPRWIADRTKIKRNDRNMHDPLYKQWHKSVKDRDGWKCRIADKQCDGRVEAHHILRWSDFPELRYVVNNGITLCHFHHPRGRLAENEMRVTLQTLIANTKKI